MLRSPKLRRAVALALLAGAVIGWPVSQLTVAKGEPPFILALSWLAIILTALDILATTDVRAEQDDDTDEITSRCERCGGDAG